MTTKTLTDGTPFIKATHHTGKAMRGIWHVTYKIDGVRALRTADGRVVSRNSKPLYNIDHLHFKDAEIFRKNWETSVSLVRTQSFVDVWQSDVYPLDQPIIPGHPLHVGITLNNPDADTCTRIMQEAVEDNYEGIVLRSDCNTKWVKVVPEKTADIRITGYEEGKGKHTGKLGALITAHGKVGTGFSDSQREQLWACRGGLTGTIVEVKYREKTPAGKLRFPVFVRIRSDKDDESIP